MTQSQCAKDYITEEWTEAINSLLKAAEDIEILENKDEYPSFSLGFEFTQDVVAGRCDGKVDGHAKTNDGLNVKEDFVNVATMCGDDGCTENVPNVRGHSVVNQGNALDVAVEIARDVASEHDNIDIVFCSALEAAIQLGDVVFHTPLSGQNVVAEAQAEGLNEGMNNEESTYAL
ncbi:hypothetical protein AAHA92_15054 [Salvia divinorum]|uniref:Uncharacterized protein n=1 Tax=Salvia divinorum TaxID=28513 RepID=A0ABD1HDM8_SALDI